MFDVVTTAIYRYARYDGGPPMEDHTMALKLFRGRHASRVYPETAELLRFGEQVCGVRRPRETIRRIAQGMSEVLAEAAADTRIPSGLLVQMRPMWERGLAYGREA